MNSYASNPKTCGVSYAHWHDLVLRLLNEKQIRKTLDDTELHELYHRDCSPEEVYYINRTKTIKHAVLRLNWFDEFGQEDIQFTTNEAIKHFYQLNPEVHKVMRGKG